MDSIDLLNSVQIVITLFVIGLPISADFFYFLFLFLIFVRGEGWGKRYYVKKTL